MVRKAVLTKKCCEHKLIKTGRGLAMLWSLFFDTLNNMSVARNPRAAARHVCQLGDVYK
eukprot:SAG31_NODE_949_length_10824_cov_2.835338_2_plen_59_part_00